MVIQEKFLVKATINRVWEFANNPEEIGSCVPGCEKIEKIDERRYLAIVYAGVGPIKVRFKFISTITEIDEPKHIHLESQGADIGKAGSFTQTSDVDLREISENEVEVSYVSNINVVGRLATFGERVMRAQAKKMGEQFIRSFKEKIEAKKGDEIMRDFEYLPTKTIKEACSLISQYKEEGKILAGGQSLITLLRQKLISPSYLIDIKGISELNYITFDEKNGLRMGALTTHRAIEKSPLIQMKYDVLSEMEKSVASVQTRNWGTIGGNLCSADPIGDPAPSLIALSTKIKIVSSRGEKTIPLEEFFTDYFTTVLEPDEILTEIQLPPPVAHNGVVYMKFSTIEAGIKIVSTSISITLESDKMTCKDARIVMSAVAPVPFNAKKAGNLMIGKKINDDLIAKAAQLASEETNPTADVHASAEFRKEIVNVLVRRATKQAFEKAKMS